MWRVEGDILYNTAEPLSIGGQRSLITLSDEKSAAFAGHVATP